MTIRFGSSDWFAALKRQAGPMLARTALAAGEKRVRRFYAGTSKYKPHQGKQEMARRAVRLD